MKNVNYNKVAGEMIRQARIEKKMTEQELAYAINPDDYIKITKLIKYWERGNGFPDLDQIYKLSEILEINPNELYYYRENGRKNLKEISKKKPMTQRQYDRKRFLEDNIEDFIIYFPAIIFSLVIVIILKGPSEVSQMIYGFFYKISHFFKLV